MKTSTSIALIVVAGALLIVPESWYRSLVSRRFQHVEWRGLSIVVDSGFIVTEGDYGVRISRLRRGTQDPGTGDEMTLVPASEQQRQSFGKWKSRCLDDAANCRAHAPDTIGGTTLECFVIGGPFQGSGPVPFNTLCYSEAVEIVAGFSGSDTAYATFYRILRNALGTYEDGETR